MDCRTQTALSHTSPGALACKLVRSAQLRRVDAAGHRDGEWVASDTVTALLDQLTQDPALDITEVLLCVLLGSRSVVQAALDVVSPLSGVRVVLVWHASQEHFSILIINSTHGVVHAFDTLMRHPDECYWSILEQFLPGAFPEVGGYRLDNHSGLVQQQGATCGPWSVWLAYAYAHRYAGCRDQDSDVVNTLVLGGTTAGRQHGKAAATPAVEFWQAVTVA